MRGGGYSLSYFLGVKIGDLVYLGVFLGKSKVFTIECLVMYF